MNEIYKFCELELFDKPNIIKVIGPGAYPKAILTEKIIKSLHGKITNSNRFKIKSNIFDSSKFAITIFSLEQNQSFPKRIHGITQHFFVDLENKIKEFYLYRKILLKSNPNYKSEPQIILINYNLHGIRFKNYKYLNKLFKYYKLLNVTIIYYDYSINWNIYADYFLCLHDSFEYNIEQIYKYSIDKSKYSYKQFVKLYNKITREDGVMVLKKCNNSKLYKLTDLYDEQAERDKIKRADPDYNPMSDESNIIFF